MAKSFNIELWEQLKADFLGGQVYFGTAPQDTPAPYCTVHVLDCGIDEESKTLCGGYNGEATIQFNIYGFNAMQVDELLENLSSLIKTYKNLIAFRICSSKRGTTKGMAQISAEVGMGLSRFDFEYESL